MASAGVRLDERAMIEHALTSLELPTGVHLRGFEEMLDSTGDPAYRITFSVSRSIPLTRKRLLQLNQVRAQVHASLTALDLGKWPYVEFAEVR